MPTPPTFDEEYAVAKAEMQARNPALTDFNEGSVLDVHAGAGAMLADQVALLVLQAFAAVYFSTATGTDLDTLAADRLGLTRKAASPSAGQVQWTPTTPGSAYTIPSGTQFSATVNGVTITVESDGDVSLGATDASVLIDCTSVDTGQAQNLAADVVDTLVTSFPTDPTPTLTNPERFVGGSPAETDAEFRDRIALYYQTVRRGTVQALRAGARQIAGVRYVTVDESDVEEAGIVYVYVGDPDARSNDALAEAVQAAYLEDWRAAGVLVTVLGSARQELAIALELTIDAGADREEILAAVRAAIAAYTATLEPSETLRISRICQVAHNAHPAIRGVSVSSPTADTAPSQRNYAIRVVQEAVSASFVEEA